MANKLVRYGTLPLWEGLELIGGPEKPIVRSTVLGQSCHTSGLRLFTFKTKGTTCVGCGLEGQFWAIERPRAVVTVEGMTHHMNLYAVKDGEEILMTHDHIVARGLGGADASHNTQPMCECCNRLKSHDESKEYAYRRALTMWLHGQRIRPSWAGKKQWEDFMKEFEANKEELLKQPPPKKSTHKRKRVSPKQSLVNKEQQVLAIINSGGILVGSIGSLENKARAGHFSSKEVWDKIKAHLATKRNHVSVVEWTQKN